MMGFGCLEAYGICGKSAARKSNRHVSGSRRLDKPNSDVTISFTNYLKAIAARSKAQ